MKKILSLFKIKKEERLPAYIALALMTALQAVFIASKAGIFMHTNGARWNIFIKNFDISGFDPITYAVVTGWEANYNVYRHPFLAFMVWPLSVLDKWIMDLTGLNLVQFLVAVPLLLCSFYAFVFIFRIFRELIRIGRTDAVILSAMTFSFAYVMMATVVPDHFGVSFFLLVFSIYIMGCKMRDGKTIGTWQTLLLFALTAGVTLSNGVKTFIYALFTNGKKFFRLKYLLLAVLLPSALIWGFARWEYRTFVLPKELARHEAKAKKDAKQRQKMFANFADTMKTKDTAKIRAAVNKEINRLAKKKYISDHKKPWNQHTGKPMGKGEFINWTDVTTPRLSTAIENLFGESIQLHDRHLLEDTLRSRPVIVRYSWIINYVVEALLVVLFAAGIWCGRRSRLLWMALAGFAFDMALHIGLGFGINEVYIMGAHWLFVMPMAMAFIIKAAGTGKVATYLRCLLGLLTLWLLGYNGTLFIGHLL